MSALPSPEALSTRASASDRLAGREQAGRGAQLGLDDRRDERRLGRR